jgi:hypothetical protein
MHAVMLDVLAPLFWHSVLQVLNVPVKIGVPEQLAGPPLITQFNAAAVSCLTSWRRMSPLGLTQIASMAELSSLTRVLLIVTPHTDSPPTSSMTACVMFTEFCFESEAWVPQNPGVRQMAPSHPSGGGLAGTDTQAPVAGLQTSLVHSSASASQCLGGPDSQRPVSVLHLSSVHLLLSCGHGPSPHPPSPQPSGGGTVGTFSHVRVSVLHRVVVHGSSSGGHGCVASH